MNTREKIKKIKFIIKGLTSHFSENKILKHFPQHQMQFRGHGIRTAPDYADFARSNYTAWMRLLVRLEEKGIPFNAKVVAEIGPGDSLGIGLCALLSGAEKYYAFDTVPTASNFENEKILEELILLFKKREPIPDDKEFPKAIPKISSMDFPSSILSEKKLTATLSNDHLQKIREALKNIGKETKQGSPCIKYFVPWDAPEQIEKGSVDLLVSFAVMEHVENISHAYKAMAQWMKKGAIGAHSIDMKNHGTAGYWNGHFTYGKTVWKIIRGKCVYFINRQPKSAHEKEMRKYFRILLSEPYKKPNKLTRKDLASSFKKISDEDMETSELFIVGEKF